MTAVVVPGASDKERRRYLQLECGHVEERLAGSPVPAKVSCGTCWREQEETQLAPSWGPGKFKRLG